MLNGEDLEDDDDDDDDDDNRTTVKEMTTNWTKTTKSKERILLQSL